MTAKERKKINSLVAGLKQSLDDSRKDYLVLIKKYAESNADVRCDYVKNIFDVVHCSKISKEEKISDISWILWYHSLIGGYCVVLDVVRNLFSLSEAVTE